MARQRIKTDFAVIGSGLAGLNFALRVAEKGEVIVLTKKYKTDANTNYAQGGIAAVFGPDDSFESHIEDTVKAGAGISNHEAVKVMVEEGPKLVKELMDIGVEFSTRKVDGKEVLDLWQEGGHSHRRILHAQDLTGREIERALLARVREQPNIRIFENFFVIDLAVDDGRCVGVYAIDEQTNEMIIISAGVVMLAAGGGGQVYLHTTNPPIATGDGIAIGFNAGCSVGNLEFVQFHPTTLYSRKPRERNLLISEAVRGEGGILIDRRGRRFMEEIHPDKELAPRDVVARAIDRVLKETGDEFVFLDIRHIPAEKIKGKFPNIYRMCLEENIDITREPIPVVPAAHYLCGGVATDLWGKTELDGLYAAGEVAYTGVHGANRLASNSLLEALVFSSRAARASLEDFKPSEPENIPEYMVDKCCPDGEEVVVAHLIKEIKHTMWDYVGIVRSDARLEKALKRFPIILEDIQEVIDSGGVSRRSLEARNMAILGYLISYSAYQRKESRGLHFNRDHPETLNLYKKPTILKKEELWNSP